MSFKKRESPDSHWFNYLMSEQVGWGFFTASTTVRCGFLVYYSASWHSNYRFHLDNTLRIVFTQCRLCKKCYNGQTAQNYPRISNEWGNFSKGDRLQSYFLSVRLAPTPVEIFGNLCVDRMSWVVWDGLPYGNPAIIGQDIHQRQIEVIEPSTQPSPIFCIIAYVIGMDQDLIKVGDLHVWSYRNVCASDLWAFVAALKDWWIKLFTIIIIGFNRSTLSSWIYYVPVEFPTNEGDNAC